MISRPRASSNDRWPKAESRNSLEQTELLFSWSRVLCVTTLALYVPPAEIIPVRAEIMREPAISITNSPDLIQLLLEDKRSADTRRAYESDLCNFFDFSGKAAQAFCAQSTPQI